MTNTNLIQAIISKGALDTNTLVTARYLIKTTLGNNWSTGLFKIKQIRRSTSKCLFDLSRVEDNVVTTIFPEHIILIDGMEPARYAEIYDLNYDGSSKINGKKRGRKPKKI